MPQQINSAQAQRRAAGASKGGPSGMSPRSSFVRAPLILPASPAAAALWASHRTSSDHDHVVGDLSSRFGAVLDAIEATDGWVTNRVTPGKIILGELGDIESGVRQLIISLAP